MEMENLEVLVCSSPGNVLYLSGVQIATQRAIPDRLAFVVWPADDEPTLLVCAWETAEVRAKTWLGDVREYVEFDRTPSLALADLLMDRGLHTRRIGIEFRHLAAGPFVSLSSALPGATLLPCDDALLATRAVKTSREVDALATAAQITDRAIGSTFSALTPTSREEEISRLLRHRLIEAGAEETPIVVVASGPNLLQAHHPGDDTVIGESTLVRTDLVGRFSGYHSDVARTVAVGSVHDATREMYSVVAAAQEAAIRAAGAGRPASDLYLAARECMDSMGHQLAMAHVGHGLGIDLHEHPLLTSGNPMRLEVGMVFCVEIILDSETGERVHIEDLVHVTVNGPRVLSRSRDWGDLITVGGASL